METESLLEGCTIVGNFKKVPFHLRPMADVLRFQCTALGIDIESTPAVEAGPFFSFEFIAPDFSPVKHQLSFWSDDPFRHGSETVMQAATGILSVHGRSIGGISPLPLPYLSTASAVVGLMGCLASAIGSKRGMDISRCQSSMASTGLLCVGQYLAGATVDEGAENIPPGCHAPDQRPPFRSADGQVFELETLSPEPWRRFWMALGVAQEEAGQGWKAFLQRYAKATSRLPEALISAVSSHSFKNIVSLGEITGVAVCCQRTLGERAHDEDVPRLLKHGPWRFKPEPPGHGALLDDETEGDGQLPLSGFTVIESCRRIQGPMAGHLLALLGARVIRIEPPGGDPLRGMPPFAGDRSARFDALNHLKEVREIDIKTPEGHAEVLALVADAEVFIHNWAPDKAAKLKLDHKHLKEVNPGIVYTYAGGWGCLDGLVQYPGTDFTVQAYSGVASEVSGSNEDNGGTLFTALDVLGGIVAAQGSVLGLFQKVFRNLGCRVDTSLLESAGLLTHSGLQRFRSHSLPQKSTGKELYTTLDGYLALGLEGAGDLKPLLQELSLSEADLQQPDIYEKLEAVLQNKTAQDWVSVFNAYGIPCCRAVESLAELPEQSRFESDLSRTPYSRVSMPWRFS